ncbi:MAG TPA: phosphoribosylamine--glycine ligase [Hyphomicrobiaceae bacterium]|nr:phosphoribosylamine--glycine ligase [Hyphomicrobiaceae bacterium]
MNVLLIGSGGREHALAWALSASPLLSKLYCAPGNAGIAELATCVGLDITDHGAIVRFCRGADIAFVVIGPEAPLVAGLADDLSAAGIKAFGPSKAAARLEGSKGFTKDLARDWQIPTAAYRRFAERGAALAYVEAHALPVVIKADGLAAGKGVTVAEDRDTARAAVAAAFAAGGEVVIEECLVGEEVSFFALVDGSHVLPLATAQDHKRAFDGDRGPNTGGMGAYSPAPVMTQALIDRTIEEIIRPTVRAMAERATPFKGVLFAGLMITTAGPKLIEYNVRFGDPECQVLMLRLKSDLLAALLATSDGVLGNFDLRWHEDAALCVVLATRGYPDAYPRGTAIGDLAAAAAVTGVTLFHAGTARVDDRLIATGGRVLNVAARAPTVGEARARAYQAVANIDWPEGFYRSDIGWRAMAREEGAP